MTHITRRAATRGTILMLALCLAAASSALAQPAPFEYRSVVPDAGAPVDAGRGPLHRPARRHGGDSHEPHLAGPLCAARIREERVRGDDHGRRRQGARRRPGPTCTSGTSPATAARSSSPTRCSVTAPTAPTSASTPAHAHMNMPATVMFVRGQMDRPARVTLGAAGRQRLEGRDAAVPDRRPARVHRAEHPLPDGQPHRVQQLHAPHASRLTMA